MAVGISMIVLGIWVITQVSAGQALERLNLVGSMVGSG